MNAAKASRYCCLVVLLLAWTIGTLGVHAADEFADVNGMRMHFEVRGHGEPLLVLHWYGSSGIQAWKPFLEEFESKYMIILPDLRGHGKTENPEPSFTHRQSAKDVLALLDHLEIDSVKAMGVSTGGMTLLHMATQQPNRIEAMVLIGATTCFPEEAREIMRQETEEIRETDVDWWQRMREAHDNDGQIRKIRRIFHEFKDSYEDMNFTPPLFSTIRARTLIIHGDRDEFFPVDISVQMYTSIPRSELWIVPGAGHVPHLEVDDIGRCSTPSSIPFVSTALRFLSRE
jgi:pimeloyl-ACP methyl ester carboxylesterase